MSDKLAVLTVILITGACLPAYAEEGPEEYCSAVIELYREGDIDAALEEAKWCVESLEQLALKQQLDGFSEQVDGWTRGEIKQHKTMGMSTIETSYTKDEKTIEVNLTTGAAGGMGALAAISQLGMQVGEKVRIQRRTALVNATGSKVEILVTLNNAGMLNFSSTSTDKDTVISFAKAFPINAIDR